MVSLNIPGARVGGGTFQRFPIFQDIADAARQPVMVNRASIAAVGLAATLCLAIPVIAKPPKPISLAMLASSTMLFSAVGFLARVAIEGEKLWATTRKVQRETMQVDMRNTLAVELLRLDAMGKAEQLRAIRQMPNDHQDFFLEKYGLTGLLPMPEPQPRQIEQVPQQQAIAITAQKSWSEEEAEAMDEAIDTSWLTPDFINSSKFIFAAKNSGKSSFLTYDGAQFLKLNPQGTLWICDLHYDRDESNWLPGVSPEILESRYLLTKPEQILRCFRKARKELEDRIQKGDRKRSLYKILCDEFDGVRRRLSEDEQDEISAIVQFIEDEGRKYGVRVVIAAHSIKKELVGLDIAAISQMVIMAMGNAIGDTTAKFPADFDRASLLKEQSQVQAMLPAGMARAIVIRELNECPKVVIVPHPNILLEGLTLNIQVPVEESIEVESEAVEDAWEDQPVTTDPLMELKTWFQAQQEEPTDGELAAKYLALTKRESNPGGLVYLRGLLRQ